MFKSYHRDEDEDLRGTPAGKPRMVRIPAEPHRSERLRDDHENESLVQSARSMEGESPRMAEA